MARITPNRRIAYFHCGSSMRVKQEKKKKNVEIFV